MNIVTKKNLAQKQKDRRWSVGERRGGGVLESTTSDLESNAITTGPHS